MQTTLTHVVSVCMVILFNCLSEILRYRDGAGNTVGSLLSSPYSECASCLQCFDTVGWAAGRASGL